MVVIARPAACGMGRPAVLARARCVPVIAGCTELASRQHCPQLSARLKHRQAPRPTLFSGRHTSSHGRVVRGTASALPQWLDPSAPEPFLFFNTAVLIPWCLMIIAPRWEVTKKLLGPTWFMVPYALIDTAYFIGTAVLDAQSGEDVNAKAVFLFTEAITDPAKMLSLFDNAAYAGQDWVHLCTWDMLGYAAFQRLNVIDKGVVSEDFVAGFTELDDSDILTPMSVGQAHEPPPSLQNKVPYVLQNLGLKDFSGCSLTMWRGRVRHHLKGGNINSHHHEVWRFLLIRNKVDGEGYLWPIGRDTDIKAKDTLDLEMTRETEMRPDVEWLDISTLDLTEFPPELFRMKKLKKLECHSNYIEVLPDEFNGDNFPNLDYLALNNCNLTTISPQLATITSLRWLSLNSNRLKEFPPIPPSVERLSLHCNQITALPKVMASGRVLRAVSLHANKIKEVPASFLSSMPVCNTFSLMRNEIAELPDTIGDMAGLQDFWIYNNHIKRIPDSIGKCKILKRFWFDNNQISEIPETIGDCSELEQIYGSCNRLTKLPVSLINCAKLDKLAIDGNPVEVMESVPAKLRGKLVNGEPAGGHSVPARPSIAPASTTAAAERSHDAPAEHMAPSTPRGRQVDGHVYVKAANYPNSAKQLSANVDAPRRWLFGWSNPMC